MKVNSIATFNPSFRHISKQAVDATIEHAEGNPPVNLMDSKQLEELKNLTLRASQFDNSWIHYYPEEGLKVEYYKDCEPEKVCRFNDNEVNAGNALKTLECAVNSAEIAETAKVNEDIKRKGIWDRTQFEISNALYKNNELRDEESNEVLEDIYSNTFDVKPLN